MAHGTPERENKIKFCGKNKKIKNNWPGPQKNSGPNPRSFSFLVRGTLGPRQVGPLLDEILATCLLGDDMWRGQKEESVTMQ